MVCCFHNIVIISYLKNLNVAPEGNFDGTYFFSFQTQCNVKIDSMSIIAILGVSKSAFLPSQCKLTPQIHPFEIFQK